MSRFVALVLLIAVVLSFAGCKSEYSLTAEEAESFVDKDYYEQIEAEKRMYSGIGLLIPFKPFDINSPTKKIGTPTSLFNNFPVLKEFKGKDESVYVNGKKYKKPKVLTLTVLLRTEDIEFMVWPTIVILKHGETNADNIYRSIRINPDTLKSVHFDDVNESAEFGDGYFGYSVAVSVKESHGVTPADYYMELFKTNITFEKTGHYTVTVIDSYKNGGKYTDNLSLVIK